MSAPCGFNPESLPVKSGFNSAPLPALLGFNLAPLLALFGHDLAPLPAKSGHNLAPLPVIFAKEAPAFPFFHFFNSKLKVKGGSVGILVLIFGVRELPSFIYEKIVNHFRVPLMSKQSVKLQISVAFVY